MSVQAECFKASLQQMVESSCARYLFFIELSLPTVNGVWRTDRRTSAGVKVLLWTYLNNQYQIYVYARFRILQFTTQPSVVIYAPFKATRLHGNNISH